MNTFLQEPIVPRHLLLRPSLMPGSWTAPSITFHPFLCLLCSPLGHHPVPQVPPAPRHPIAPLFSIGLRSDRCSHILLVLLISCRREIKPMRAVILACYSCPVSFCNQKHSTNDTIHTALSLFLHIDSDYRSANKSAYRRRAEVCLHLQRSLIANILVTLCIYLLLIKTGAI